MFICMVFEVLPDNMYFPALFSSLSYAKNEILAVIYHVKYNVKRVNDPAFRIMRALCDAAKRGVVVKVLLFAGTPHLRLRGINKTAGRFLSEHGVDVRYWRKGRVLHTKLFVIDWTKAYVGSHNISRAGLSQSAELSVFFSDDAYARRCHERFFQLWGEGVA